MGGAPATTLLRSVGNSITSIGPSNAPKGLSGSGLHTPAGALCSGGARNIRRQYTMCKSRPGDLQQAHAFPFMLDLTLALVTDIQPPSIVQSSLDEVVFQATLQVPAHHALSCKLQAYGTPFAAPDLQASADELSDADLEFAACLASPPDLDEQMSFNLGRVMSLLEQNRGGAAGAVGRVAQQQQLAPTTAAAQNTTGISAAQQLRAGGGVGQQSAPRVLVSVDDAEAGAQQLQRSNSTKQKLPQIQIQGLAKRAIQALLGFGYLLTVLHEKQLGGHLEFSASAVTAASSSTPSRGSSSHTRFLSRRRSSSSRAGRMLSAFQQMMQDCPSLVPMLSPQQHKPPLPAAAAGATPFGTMVGFTSPNGVNEADASPAAAADGAINTARSIDTVWQQIDSAAHPRSSSSGSSTKQPVTCLALQLSATAPISKAQSSSLEKLSMSLTPRRDTAAAGAAAGDGSNATPTAAAAANLHKESAHGRSGNMDKLLDNALQNLEVTDLPTATEAAESTAAAAASGDESNSSCTPRVLKPMLSMRLYSIMSPKWEYDNKLEDLRNSAAAAAAAAADDDVADRNDQQQQQHEEEDEVVSPLPPRYAGLWPSMSFSLRPVRLQSPGGQLQQQHAAFTAATR